MSRLRSLSWVSLVFLRSLRERLLKFALRVLSIFMGGSELNL